MTTTSAATVQITVVDQHTIRVRVGERRFLVESSCPHRGGPAPVRSRQPPHAAVNLPAAPRIV